MKNSKLQQIKSIMFHIFFKVENYDSITYIHISSTLLIYATIHIFLTNYFSLPSDKNIRESCNLYHKFTYIKYILCRNFQNAYNICDYNI